MDFDALLDRVEAGIAERCTNSRQATLRRRPDVGSGRACALLV